MTCRYLEVGHRIVIRTHQGFSPAEKTSQALRERTNNEKRQRSELRKALRIRKVDFEDEDSEGGYDPSKRPKLANTALRRMAPTLNYVGTSLPVPLSLTMNSVVPMTRKFSNSKGKLEGEFITAGLPPNAVDSEGNILVTDYDILVRALLSSMVWRASETYERS